MCEYASGSRYEGLWLDGLRHGEGVLISRAGDAQRGVWHRDENVTSATDAHERGDDPESLADLAAQKVVAA